MGYLGQEREICQVWGASSPSGASKHFRGKTGHHRTSRPDPRQPKADLMPVVSGVHKLLFRERHSMVVTPCAIPPLAL